MRSVALGQDDVSDQDAAVLAHRGAHVGENGAGVLVVPVVDDMLEQIDVGPCRHRLVEVPGHELDAIRNAIGLELGGRILEDVGCVEEHATRLRVRLQDRGERVAVAAGDVRNHTGLREVVGREDGGDRRVREARHRAREGGAEFGVLAEQIREQRRAVHLLPDRLAGLDRIEQAAPHPPVRLGSDPPHEVADAIRNITAQRLGLRRVGEHAALDLAEAPRHRERAEDPAQRARIGADGARHLIDRARAVAQLVGHTELGGDVHRLRDVETAQRADHLDFGGQGVAHRDLQRERRHSI